MIVNWTIILSVGAVAAIFASAWFGSKAIQMRAELEKCMAKDKEDAVRKYHDNKTRISVLEEKLVGLVSSIEDIKDRQENIERKIDTIILYLPKRGENHLKG